MELHPLATEDWPTREELRRLEAGAREVAGRLRLSLAERRFSGPAGASAGVGTGQSIDYRDHRAFLPGDDPRRLDWAAYARTGQTILKVYEEEVSPQLDLVLDASRSMFFDRAKRDRSLELFYFCLESAQRARMSLSCYGLAGAKLQRLPLAAIHSQRSHSWLSIAGDASSGHGPDLSVVPFRPHSLRVLISDLLFPGSARSLVSALSGRGLGRPGFGALFVPRCRAEAEPDWAGNLDLVDVETGRRRRQRVDGGLLERYLASYRRHFALYEEEARRQSVQLVPVSSEVDLAEALIGRGHPLGGAVEAWT